MTTVDPVAADAAPPDIDAFRGRARRLCFSRFSGLMLSAVASAFACSPLPMLPIAATASEQASLPHPLVPFSAVVDHWDHHWFLWLRRYQDRTNIHSCSPFCLRQGRQRQLGLIRHVEMENGTEPGVARSGRTSMTASGS
jgi:hypothetical protein